MKAQRTQTHTHVKKLLRKLLEIPNRSKHILMQLAKLLIIIYIHVFFELFTVRKFLSILNFTNQSYKLR